MIVITIAPGREISSSGRYFESSLAATPALKPQHAMYYDLHVPYRTPDVAPKKKSKDKGKAKEEEPKGPPNCWAGLSATERADVARKVSLAGHRESWRLYY